MSFLVHLRKRSTLLILLKSLNAVVFLTAIALLIFSLVFINKPGPTVYYSYFATIYLSSCLAFQCLQFLRVPSQYPKRSCNIIFKYAYWATLCLCGLMAGIAYCCTPKPDCAAIEIMVFLHAGGFLFFLCFVKEADSDAQSINLVEGPTSRTSLTSKPRPLVRFAQIASERVQRWKPATLPNWVSKTFRIINRFLMVLHVLFSILAISGAIQLALLYRFDNPGETVEIALANGDHRSLNYNCTTVPWNGTVFPTIWLEADQAHGIVDFMGVQHHLAITHGRNSCAYDPPNFGWSERLPAKSKTYYEYFVPLLKALGRSDEEIVLVGWGAGAEQVVRHAVELPALTRGLVLLDVSLDGIEWMDERRVNNWTEEEMLQKRKADLAGRVELTRILLSLGIPWGLMSVFIPNNPAAFFDKSLYQRFRAQGMKEDMWVYQYFALRDMAAGDIDRYLADTTVPPSIPVYAVMTFNASTTAAGSEFYRKTRLESAEGIAGGNLSSPVIFCMDDDCDLGFPVKKSAWTASSLISLGI